MTTVLLDTNNLAKRAFHASKHSMTTADGIETGSLHIFARSLSNLLHQLRPSRFVAVWDGGVSTYRVGLYPGYKAARRQATLDDGFVPHGKTFALIQEFLDLANITQWRQAGVEADDLIAKGVEQEVKRDLRDIVILSSDKDLLQCLVNDRVSQWRFTSDGPEIWTRARVVSEYGYGVELIPYAMALTGDTSDSIPGAKGIGPVKAAQLLVKAAQYQSTPLCPGGFDNAFKFVTQHRPDFRMIELSHELVKLPAPGIEVPLVPDYRPLSPTSVEPDWWKMADFCTRYQLRVLWSELEAGTLLAQGSPV